MKDEMIPVEDRVLQLAEQQLFDMDRVKRALRKKDDSAVVSITKAQSLRAVFLDNVLIFVVSRTCLGPTRT
jgi:hypothetical protein